MKGISALGDTAGKVWLLLLINALLWALLPWLSAYSLPLDVVEGLFWGQEWQWGYYKHPPLPSWLVQLSWLALADLGPFLLSQLTILTTLLFVWLLGLRLLGGEKAALGTLLLLGVYYFTWPTPEYNHNIAQMPFWAAATYFYHCAITDGRYRSWLLVGLFAGLGLLTKYVMVVLLAAMFLHLLTQQEARKQLLRWPLWSGVLLMAAIFLPHLLWLIQHDFLPLSYAGKRSGGAAGLEAHLLGPLKFLLVQLLDHLPLVLLLAASGFFTSSLWCRDQADVQAKWFLFCLGLGPALLTALGAGLTGTGLRDMWGTPMWNLSGLLLAAWLITPLAALQQKKLLRNTLVMVLLLVMLRLMDMSLLPYLKDKPSRIAWPDKAMAVELEKIWADQTGCPLDIVASEYWLGGLMALRASTQPSVLIDGRLDYSPWIDEARLTQSGALLIWQQGDEVPTDLAWLGAIAAQGAITLDWPMGSAAPLQLHWAVVAPAYSCD
ncbi:glycosyltransferase family 39 protein [Nitrincola sp.]|uniref:glycosyltransferase family 39 protein n=1 Tax=Nitrincola sp. TaxID=1926584 RepID=UPI003A92FC43